MINALSIDLEEYYQAETLTRAIGRGMWARCPRRLRPITERLLELLNSYNVKATFFVLGSIAETEPELIHEIWKEGHEIGCHGYAHQLIYNQSPAEFRTDLKKSKHILEDIIPQPIKGYRAPTFSIVESSLWALDILIEEGFSYDSSIFPIVHDRYGFPACDRFPHQIIRDRGKIYEFPLSTWRILNYNLPIAGGGYLRLFPYWITRQGINRLNSRGKPAVVYFHPWELDGQQPQIAKLPPLLRLRHYYHLGQQMEKRVKRLLEEFAFAPLAEVLY